MTEKVPRGTGEGGENKNREDSHLRRILGPVTFRNRHRSAGGEGEGERESGAEGGGRSLERVTPGQ